MRVPAALTVRCPGKVNLHLEVVGRRPDGYHELRTLFVAVGIWDELRFDAAPVDTLELTVEPVGAVPSGEDNLVLRAARALQRRSGTRRGARIHLRKGIPIAGGMGGGSSDAAAALVGLAAHWGLALAPRDLQGLAALLGADVPFFLVGGAAWGVGRGTELTALADLPPWWVVLMPGDEAIPTAKVYRALDAGPVDETPGTEVYEWVVSRGGVPFALCRNDLEPTVLRLWPRVAARLEAVRGTQPLMALLSGSGGTVFGLYRDEQAARCAAGALARHGPVLAPLLTRKASLLRPSEEEAAWK